ncbi:MAG: glycoside hydrolase family 3 N-terminal domain-containing protein, partial [Elusimicrobiota bacterium]
PGFTVGKQDSREAEDLVRLGVGGFCLYRGTPSTLAALTARLRRVAGRPLLFCADYEEGPWAHVSGSTALPTNLGIGASGSAAAAREKGLITAREARALGIDWVLAPVLDLAGEPANPIVNLRAFSDRADEAARLARAFLAGLREGGALGCLKHFPGHGSTRQDSHLDLPRVSASRATLARRELAPFKALARGADSVMTAHLLVPALEPQRIPFTLSAAGPRLLRSWGFRGLVTTDALDMKAVSDRFGESEAALLALRGGADILLVPRDARALIAELRIAVANDSSLAQRAAESCRRLDQVISRVPDRRPSVRIVGSTSHRRRAVVLFDQCLAWSSPLRVRSLSRAVYFEPQGSRPPEGRAFVSALRRCGVKVRLGRSASAGETLVVGVFVGPRAYCGRIRLSPGERACLWTALHRAPAAVVVSFGSPFELAGLPPRVAGLCAFSRAEAAQDAAARVLADRPAIRGRMPVMLKEESWVK